MLSHPFCPTVSEMHQLDCPRPGFGLSFIVMSVSYLRESEDAGVPECLRLLILGKEDRTVGGVPVCSIQQTLMHLNRTSLQFQNIQAIHMMDALLKPTLSFAAEVCALFFVFGSQSLLL